MRKRDYRRQWSAAEARLLRAMYPHCHTQDVALWLHRSVPAVYNHAILLGLRKSAEYLASDCAMRIRRGCEHPAMIASRLRPGHTPWNKGRKGVNGYSATRFKPGHRPQTRKPVGTVMTHRDGPMRKIRDTGNRKRDWVYVHHQVWEAAHGPIRAGQIIAFKLGMQTTDVALIAVERLECIDRAELARRNSCYARFSPELARLIQLRGALNRQINKRARATEAA
jgi:hypothetical protein